MVKKTSSKNVLDYDPLAWLDESEDKDSQSSSDNENDIGTVQSAKTNATLAKKGAKKATPKATVKKADKKIEKATQTKSDDIQATAARSEMNISDSSEDDTQAFGFFDELPDEVIASTAQQDEAGDVIRLGAELTVKSVTSCKTLIDRTISNGFDVKIDAGDLQKIDTAGLQLLYSLKKTLQQSSQVVHWESANPIINRAATIIGIQDLFEDPQQGSVYGFFSDESDGVANPEQQESGYGFF